MNASLFIVEAAVVVLTAPLAGVALGSRLADRGVWAALGPPTIALAALLSLSGLATIAARGVTNETLRTALVSHTTLGAAALALGAFGALCRSAFRDPLDAAACGAGLAIVAAAGLFAAGPAVADLPTPLVNAALAANPIVATASAANIDLLRTDLLYRLSPLAHRRFDYPVWYAASAGYLAVAIICVACVARLRPPKGSL